MTNVSSCSKKGAMPLEPVSTEIAAALARFFAIRGSPSHRELAEIFKQNELDAFDPDPDATENIGKERRVRVVLSTSAEHPSSRSTSCVSQLLGSLRAAGCFDPASTATFAGSDLVNGAKRAFRNAGWALDDDGMLGPLVLGDIETAERRPAIEMQIDRMRNGSSDTALLIGTAKELLETTARYTLEELGGQVGRNMDFDQLLYLARDRLNLLPSQFNNPSEKLVQKIFQSLWSVAETVNELRGEDGTGHGSTSPTDIPPYLARSIVQAAGVMAQLMVTRLDVLLGRRTY